MRIHLPRCAAGITVALALTGTGCRTSHPAAAPPPAIVQADLAHSAVAPRFTHLGPCKRALFAARQHGWQPTQPTAELLPPSEGVEHWLALVIDSTYVGVLRVPVDGRIDSLPLIREEEVGRIETVRGVELRDVIGFPGSALICVERRTT